jgi:fumarate hydratase class II
MTELYRRESDSMGEISIPAKAYWGAQTERSRQNFCIGKDLMPFAFIHALAIQKRCAAFTSLTLGKLAHPIANAIIKAADEIISGQWADQFPLVIWQTGSGTQTNMNMNEVMANRASELLGFSLNMTREAGKPVHPNDHVNYAQSTNDSFPTAMHIAAVQEIHHRLVPAVQNCQQHFQHKEKEFLDIVKVGRTHLQDATLLTLGQEFSGYAQQLHLSLDRLQDCLKRLYPLAQGGTAVGTGLNCPPGFDRLFAKTVQEYTGLPFRTASNKFEALATHDALVELSGVLNVLAVSMMKIANDIRWLGSGPRCGLGELNLPQNEPGSSIMPGKVNPTQCEALAMVACQVMGNHTTITIAGSQGNFELNVYKPVIIANILQSIELLAGSITSFTQHCLKGITPNYQKLADNVANCLMTVASLNPVIGYDKAARVAKKALAENITLEKAVVDLGYLTADEFHRSMKPV